MVCYLQDATHSLELFLINGTPIHKYSLPIGTITDYFGDTQCSRFYFTFTSYTTPDTVHYIEISSKCRSCQKLNPWGYRNIKKVNVNKDLQNKFKTKGYIVKKLFCQCPSGDGKIPIFVIHKKVAKNVLLKIERF